jgi:Fe-S cluster biosynthesis and repair protein YggX
MTKMIECAKFKKTLPGLTQAPYPGELGQKIVSSISQLAWKQWLEHQTILINEYRLNLMDPDARKMLEAEMENFLFGEGSTVPEAFTPPDA